MKVSCIIVDDEKLARDLLAEYLEDFPDIEVLVQCSKGVDAVEKINELKPNLIFLDVQIVACILDALAQVGSQVSNFLIHYFYFLFFSGVSYQKIFFLCLERFYFFDYFC